MEGRVLLAAAGRISHLCCPIVLVVGTIFWFCFGLDEAVEQRSQGPAFYWHLVTLRNRVRSISVGLWLSYSVFADSSSAQGTLGKRIMRLKVVDETGIESSRGRR